RFLSGYDKVLATAAPKNPQLILQGNELVSGCIGFGPGACSGAGAGADADADADVYIDADTDADADDSSVCMGLGSAQTSASSASSVTEFDGEFAAASCKHSRAAYKDSSSQTAAETTASYNDVFRRKWEYYFAYCEGAFATRTLGCSQLVFSRTYNEGLCDPSLIG
ncbi:hypothetical protein LPJ57_006695, partial [Coemansia sp. RSA 486]